MGESEAELLTGVSLIIFFPLCFCTTAFDSLTSALHLEVRTNETFSTGPTRPRHCPPYRTFDFSPCAMDGAGESPAPSAPGRCCLAFGCTPRAVRPRIGSPVTQQVSCRTSGCVSLRVLYMPHFAHQGSGQACRPIIMKASRADTVTCSNFSNEWWHRPREDRNSRQLVDRLVCRKMSSLSSLAGSRRTCLHRVEDESPGMNITFHAMNEVSVWS